MIALTIYSTLNSAVTQRSVCCKKTQLHLDYKRNILSVAKGSQLQARIFPLYSHFIRTVNRLSQPHSLPQNRVHLKRVNLSIRLLAQCHYLPQQHTPRPLKYETRIQVSICIFIDNIYIPIDFTTMKIYKHSAMPVNKNKQATATEMQPKSEMRYFPF